MLHSFCIFYKYLLLPYLLIVFAHFVCLCHGLVILRMCETLSLLHLFCWSVIFDVVIVLGHHALNPYGKENLIHKYCMSSDSSTDCSLPHLSPSLQFSSVQLLSRVQLFATPWTTARQASLSITNSQSLPKPMSIESVMPSNHLILCRSLLLLPLIPPSIRVFSNESAPPIR